MLKTVGKLCLLILVPLACAPVESRSDRQIIEAIVVDLVEGAASGDLMKVEQHLSQAAKQSGYESNRFVMECSYGPDIAPQFAAQSIRVMSDSAHVTFVLLPEGRPHAESDLRSDVRLVKARGWQIESFELIRNR